jgi:polar amino acid transport system ATP-binding protein
MKEDISMIELCSVVKSYDGVRVLDDVSLAVKKGEVAALIGPSGGGKSTLLRCINGLERFQAGEILIGGVKLSAPTIGAVRRRVGMVFQQFFLFENMTVLENVASGPRFVLGRDEVESRRIARRFLDRVGLAQKADAEVAQLSGGQQQRVAIARALAVEPDVILFDEPTSALDPEMTREVTKVIAELKKAGQTMLIVTHAIDFAGQIADVVHEMKRGRVVPRPRPS